MIMNWAALTTEDQVSGMGKKSFTRPQVIFKHSTRCSLSSVAWNRIGKIALPESADFYFLDVIRHRLLSDTIAETFSVYHETPQLLVIKNGECIYEESHMAIQPDELAEALAQ